MSDILLDTVAELADVQFIDNTIEEARQARADVIRIVEGLTTKLELWDLSLKCPYVYPEDGCCGHPNNITPECHIHICPRVRVLDEES